MTAGNLADFFADDQRRDLCHQTRLLLGSLVQQDQYVGEVFSLSYETADVQIHDFHRRKVGGIPSLSFLVATRVSPSAGDIDFQEEDASVILLRVMDSARLPNDQEATRVRSETAQRVAGEIDKHWDEATTMDPHTNYYLSFAGVKCRVLGTFYLELDPVAPPPQPPRLMLRFGSDISNYYPNRGLKVFKPNGEALRSIANYRDVLRDRESPLNSSRVEIGAVRYASTNRSFQGVSGVPVSMSPADLLGQKTALFGMTRTGKSNTTKIMAKSVFMLRFSEPGGRIGQLIFDPDGEYANENEQDKTALKNVWRCDPRGKEEDVVTYGLRPHPQDPGRRLMLLNFYDSRNLQIGKEIIDSALEGEQAKYVRNFVDVSLSPPEGMPQEPEFRSAKTRYERRVLVYRTLLHKAVFAVPGQLKPVVKGLFSGELLGAMAGSKSNDAAAYKAAAEVLGSAQPMWSQMETALSALRDFIADEKSGYKEFNEKYVSKKAGDEDARPWADDDLKKLLEMFHYPNGSRLLGRVRDQHTETTTDDYAVEIANVLAEGRLVIVDQSSGDTILNKSSADRIMAYVFNSNQAIFRQGGTPPEMLIYIEEAHTVLPAGTETDLTDVWVRAAKEGAKYRIGMVYATQEVSSIQRNILKNTSNWFIGHLNNTDETKEISKYYDFQDFEGSIRRAQDRGFLRMKTLSNPFVVPVQVVRFEV